MTNEGRRNEGGDEIAQAFFSPADLQMAPEEYAARHAHEWGCFSLHRHLFRDAVLGAWIYRLGDILFDAEEIERCRQRFLTPAELADVRRKETEEL